jgi:hypothetical protein
MTARGWYMNRFVWTLFGALVLSGSAYAQPAPAPVRNIVPKDELPPPPRESREPRDPRPPVFPQPQTQPQPMPPNITDVISGPIVPGDSCGCDGGCCNLAHPWRGNTACACDTGFCGPTGSPMWLDIDYLYWRVRGDFLPALVTTGPPNATVATAGVLPNATVIFGNELTNNQPRSGTRLTLGGWLNEAQTIGLQASGFLMSELSTTASFASSDGSTVLARPFTSITANAATQSSQLIAFPNVIGGGIHISEENALQGFEFAFRGNGCCGPNWRLDALIGYRYLHFSEALLIQEQLLTGALSQNTLAVPPGTSIGVVDSFRAVNSFHGLQLGLTAEARAWEKFTFLATVKASLGYIRQEMTIDGATRFTPPDVSNRVGGLLALDSNIGNYRRNEATLVPELNFVVLYQLNRTVRLKFGYDLIYFANTQRAGSAIDLGIDRNRIPPTNNPTIDRPNFRFSTDNMLIDGVNAGLEFRF